MAPGTPGKVGCDVDVDGQVATGMRGGKMPVYVHRADPVDRFKVEDEPFVLAERRHGCGHAVPKEFVWLQSPLNAGENSLGGEGHPDASLPGAWGLGCGNHLERLVDVEGACPRTPGRHDGVVPHAV